MTSTSKRPSVRATKITDGMATSLFDNLPVVPGQAHPKTHRALPIPTGMPDDRADTDDLRFDETYDSPPCSGRRKPNHRSEIDIGGPAVVLQGSQQRQVDLVDFGTHFADRPDHVADHLDVGQGVNADDVVESSQFGDRAIDVASGGGAHLCDEAVRSAGQ